MANKDLGPWVYTTNHGRNFVRRADKSITGQEATAGNPNVGGASAATLPAGEYESFPANWRPRGVYMGAAGRPSRFVVCYEPDAPLLGLTPPTMSLKDQDGVAATYTVERSVDERLGRIIKRGQ